MVGVAAPPALGHPAYGAAACCCLFLLWVIFITNKCQSSQGWASLGFNRGKEEALRWLTWLVVQSFFFHLYAWVAAACFHLPDTWHLVIVRVLSINAISPRAGCKKSLCLIHYHCGSFTFVSLSSAGCPPSLCLCSGLPSSPFSLLYTFAFSFLGSMLFSSL